MYFVLYEVASVVVSSRFYRFHFEIFNSMNDDGVSTHTYTHNGTVATDHISTIELASHGSNSNILFTHSPSHLLTLFGLSCYQTRHVFHFCFWCLNKRPPNGHMYYLLYNTTYTSMYALARWQPDNTAHVYSFDTETKMVKYNLLKQAQQ